MTIYALNAYGCDPTDDTATPEYWYTYCTFEADDPMEDEVEAISRMLTYDMGPEFYHIAEESEVISEDYHMTTDQIVDEAVKCHWQYFSCD